MPASEPAGANPVVGRRVALPGHFEGAVEVESVRTLGGSVELRVRLASGQLEEAVLSSDEYAALATTRPACCSGTLI